MPLLLRVVTAVLLVAAGVALLTIGQPSPTLLGLGALWCAGLLLLSLRSARAPRGR